jgi:hypothetical protein
MRRFLFLVTFVAVVTIAASGAASGGVSGARAVPVLPGSRTAAGPTLSVSSQLDVRRYAASGDRAYELGTEDGRYRPWAAHYTVRDTNAGREVMVSTPCRGQTWRVHVVAG